MSDNENIQLGSKLRDAAVDPQPGDYRPYVNDRVEPEAEIHLGTKLRDAAVDPRPEDHQVPVKVGTLTPVSVQALSPRSGNPPFVDGARWVPPEAS